jgi:hypothetical protein
MTTPANPPPATHSPLPWAHNEPSGVVVDAAGEWVCQFWSKTEEDFKNASANAAFIVAACNGHAKLVEALRSFPALPFIEDMTTDQMANKLREISAWLDTAARSALAAAGEKP